MPGTYTTPTPIDCKICGEHFDFLKKFTNHLAKAHKLKSIDYAIVHLYDGVKPSCLECGGETRYQSLEFKRYCREHSHIAEALAGSLGGRAKKTWNKDQTKDTNPILAQFSKACLGAGNPFFGKTHAPELMQQINDKNRLTFEEVQRRVISCAHHMTLLSTSDDYQQRQVSKLHLRCDDCGTEDHVTLFNVERCWMCRECYPVGSRDQIELFHFIRDELGFIDAVLNDRTVIDPYELDIWIPSKRVAFEYHGLYWHSVPREQKEDTKNSFERARMKQKHMECVKQNVRLVQFFSDEWRDKIEICKSMVRNVLGVVPLKLNARDCELIEVNTMEAQDLLEKSHLNGYTRSSYKIGLKHPIHGLVSVATIRTPIQKKWGDVLELARMASLPNIVVRGGASKMLKHLFKRASDLKKEGLLSYADLRTGTGGVYEACGFDFMGATGQGYWYTSGRNREDRFKYRAQNGMTENEYVKSQGVRAVWNVGNAVYLKKII